MNQIKNIEIKSFKSIRHQKIEGCKRINVFIGYPNVGKSNLLEALSLFCITNETVFTNFIRVKEDPTLFFNGFISNSIEIKINNLFEIFCKYSNGELKIIEQYLETYSNSETTFATPILKENYFKNFVFSRSKPSQVVVPGLNIKKYEFKKDVVRSFDEYEELKTPFGDNLFSLISSNEEINKEVTELFKSIGLNFLYDTASQSYKILKYTASGIFTVPYDLIADTLQRLIFYKAAILSNKETVLLFEEPEAHMFPPYISKFTADITYDKNDNQFFLSTHSPFVVNDFMENLKNNELSIYIVGYKKDAGETVIRRLSDIEVHEIYQFGTDIFLNLENYLENERQ